MAESRPTNRSQAGLLMVRVDEESYHILAHAELRQISVSDYCRQVTVSQAR